MSFLHAALGSKLDLLHLFARQPLSNLWSYKIQPSRVLNQQFFEGQNPVVFFGLKYSCESKRIDHNN